MSYKSLNELVKLRVSQMNGCALFHRHAFERCAGRGSVYALNASREMLVFSEREPAALEWAEKITNIGVA